MSRSGFAPAFDGYQLLQSHFGEGVVGRYDFFLGVVLDEPGAPAGAIAAIADRRQANTASISPW
jgi:hypothetical protein